ncbi:MAG TPA: DUF134 domain-containing protein [Desulfuromonadales bacterium]|nr:DUF134 domain-containing protein [Desulfuromonadales bacterium]
MEHELSQLTLQAAAGSLQPVRKFMSPRPKKPRRCHCSGQTAEVVYKPVSVPMSELSQVVLFHDEVEALLFCDEQGLTQEEAGEKMGISRGTVQRLVTSGRRKLIKTITTGQALVVEPG